MLAEEVAIGWKVVSDHLFSLVMPTQQGGVQYSFGKWVYPAEGCGPFAVFYDRGSAVGYTRKLLGGAVGGILPIDFFKCEYVKAEDQCLWAPPDKRMVFGFPPGTVFASAVKLVRG